MMQVLADEMSNTNVRVNAINPGGTRTAMRAKAYPAEDSSLLKTPADIMPLYLYLMGPESKDVNGQCLMPSRSASQGGLLNPPTLTLPPFKKGGGTKVYFLFALSLDSTSPKCLTQVARYKKSSHWLLF